MKLNRIFGDGMILQQEKPVNISGCCEPDTKVTVKIECESISRQYSACSNKAGNFSVCIPGTKGGFSRYRFEIFTDKEYQTIDNVVFGEVWICAGQSNMEYQTKYLSDRDEHYKMAGNEFIRFLTVGNAFVQENGDIFRPFDKQSDLSDDYKWIDSSKVDNVKEFSGIGFGFTTRLFAALMVPIGILSLAVGGSGIDSWIDREEIDKSLSVRKYLIKIDKYLSEESKYNRQGYLNFTQMSGIYNEKIHPLTQLSIKGVIWYQGENSSYNYKSARMYEPQLKLLVNSYRKAFRDVQMPFLISHIACHYYQYTNAGNQVNHVNESIDNVTRKYTNVFSIPIYDLKLEWINLDKDLCYHPIHPTNKTPIANRMALLAMNKIYKIGNYEAPPDICDTNYKNDRIVLRFVNIGNGLKTSDGKTLYGFTIAGEDSIYYEAKASITGKDTVEVSSPYVAKPTNYAYSFFLYNEMSNLQNSYGMPALPFRSKQEDTIGKNYYSPQYYASCDFKYALENNWGPNTGGALYKKTWVNGRLFGTKKLKIGFDKKIKSQGRSSLKIDYTPENESFFYIGVSPEISLTGDHTPLDKFKYMSIDILNTNNREITFHGAVFKTTGNELFTFCVEKDEFLSNEIKINEYKFVTYKLNLERVIGCSGEENVLTRSQRENIYVLQFTFRDLEKGTIHLDNINFHN